MHLAYFTPLPPARSGIADYSRDLLPALQPLVDLTLFVDRPEEAAATWRNRFDVAATADYPRRRWEFDLALYHMGNNRQHTAIYALLRRYPGVVVLHDYVLHHLMATLGYGRELGYALGAAGAWGVRFGRIPPPIDSLPLNQRLLDTSLGVIVHSRYVAELIRAARPDLALSVVPMPVTLLPPVPAAAQLRAALGLPEDALVLASLGQITPNRQPALSLRVFSRLQRRFPNLHYVIVGEARDVAIGALIAELPATAQAQVHVTGFVDDPAQFDAYLALADVVLNVRYPTMGETSGVALRALAAGKPLVVFDLGWYHELSEGAVKVAPMDEASLVAEVARLLDSAETRAALGQAGRVAIANQHTPSAAAAAYRAFLESVLAHYA